MLAGFSVGGRQWPAGTGYFVYLIIAARLQCRMKQMDDRDIHQVFMRALPSEGWCSQPLLVALVDIGDWKSCLPGALALLDTAENLRLRRKRNPGDREVLALAYAMHRLLLGHALGMDPTAVPLWRDLAGCPRVGNNLVHTSLSHAGEWIALAVSRVGPIGVDIEPLSRMAMLPELADTICSPSERRELETLSAEQRGRSLLALWVRKEALLKAAGTGLSVEMSSFSAPEGQILPMPILAGVSCLEMLDAGPGCLAALAKPAGSMAVVSRLFPAVPQ